MVFYVYIINISHYSKLFKYMGTLILGLFLYRIGIGTYQGSTIKDQRREERRVCVGDKTKDNST